MMFFGFFIFVLILYFLFRRPYGASHMGCCMPGHDHMIEPGKTGQSNARTILDERYVKGEISDEEYRTKKANLS